MSNKTFYTLITGASEGLGKAFALECAGRGHQLILVALPQSRLNNLAAFIRCKYNVDVIIYELDLSLEASCHQLHSDVRSSGVQVNILINNAGVGHTRSFTESKFESYKLQVDLNITSMVLLTHLFLPCMHKQPSYILNVSSLCTFFYLPQKQVYGATKSFVYFFSRSLRKELKPYDISVSVLCPGGMNTNLYQFLSNRSLSPIGRLSLLDPAKVAYAGITGLLKRKETIIPGKLNRLFLIMDKVVFQSVKDLLINGQVNRMTKSV